MIRLHHRMYGVPWLLIISGEWVHKKIKNKLFESQIFKFTYKIIYALLINAQTHLKLTIQTLACPRSIQSTKFKKKCDSPKEMDQNASDVRGANPLLGIDKCRGLVTDLNQGLWDRTNRHSSNMSFFMYGLTYPPFSEFFSEINSHCRYRNVIDNFLISNKNTMLIYSGEIINEYIKINHRINECMNKLTHTRGSMRRG